MLIFRGVCCISINICYIDRTKCLIDPMGFLTVIFVGNSVVIRWFGNFVLRSFWRPVPHQNKPIWILLHFIRRLADSVLLSSNRWLTSPARTTPMLGNSPPTVSRFPGRHLLFALAEDSAWTSTETDAWSWKYRAIECQEELPGPAKVCKSQSQHLGVSTNFKGTPKWMIYNGKPY